VIVEAQVLIQLAPAINIYTLFIWGGSGC